MTEEEKELLKEYQDLIKSYDNNYEEEKEEDHENQTIELNYLEQEDSQRREYEKNSNDVFEKQN